MKAALNKGNIYRDRISLDAEAICSWYAKRWPHSSLSDWQQRLDSGEIRCNGAYWEWHRPPWLEEAVPDEWSIIYNNNDLLIINKPSGLPVLPAGGFMEHSLLKLLEKQYQGDKYGLPRPVHRLGRFTSGLLVCARKSCSRAWLSALLRDHGAQQGCCKIYRALLQIPAPGSALLDLEPEMALELNTAIGQRAHRRLGSIWAAAIEQKGPGVLQASSQLQLLQKQADAWLVQFTITTGRPHQIRIHAATAGAPLLGDPLYQVGGTASDALPGEGGYHLHAHRLVLPLANGEELKLEAPLPKELELIKS